MKEYCYWKYLDILGEVYETTCKNASEFLVGDIKDNKYKFCPYCGKEIKERP